MKKLFTAFCLLALFSLPSTYAQIKTPAPSPMAKIEQTVGLTDVTIEYSRPGKKDRNIFAADGLVPYGEIWRTGANASTKIEFSDDVKIAGQALPKGKYALYTIPNANEWTIIFHKNLTYWGTGGKDYNTSEDALRVTVKPEKTAYAVESFTIDLGHLRDKSAHLIIAWDDTMVRIPVDVEVDSKVMKDIENAMAGTTRGEYYTAARFYYNNDKDLSQALTWAKKANEIESKFWQLKLQSQIEAKLGDYKSAIATAEKSKASAEKAGNMDYVRSNTKNIEKWSKMMAKKS